MYVIVIADGGDAPRVFGGQAAGAIKFQHMAMEKARLLQDRNPKWRVWTCQIEKA